MGTITVERQDNLFWLGRYIERVYQSLRYFGKIYDEMIDGDEKSYKKLCENLSIAKEYNSAEDFIEDFYNPDNPNSFISNLTRAYDNAMVMRDEISTQALSYIHLALSLAKNCSSSEAPIFYFQKLQDYILAFWGSLDDEVDSEQTRSIVKVGKRLERLDLFIRFKMPGDALRREIGRLMHRIDKAEIEYNHSHLMHAAAMAEDDEIDYGALLEHVMNIF